MANVLFVNKPKGITSFDVCYKLRKVLNTTKIGHTGTLDPNATGVMVVLYNNATKANQFLVTDTKEYICTVKIGIETNTLDIDGDIVKQQTCHMPDKDLLKEVLLSFLGKSKQEVPITSSIKVNGKKLYEYQRQNIAVELPIRDIEVFDIELIECHEDTFTFRSKVSSGTYIRALARDVLSKLNIIGTVSELCRSKIDKISIEQCDTLDNIIQGKYIAHELKEILLPKYECIDYPNRLDIINGKRVKFDCESDKVLVLNNNELLALYEKDNDEYRCLRGLL